MFRYFSPSILTYWKICIDSDPKNPLHNRIVLYCHRNLGHYYHTPLLYSPNAWLSISVNIHSSRSLSQYLSNPPDQPCNGNRNPKFEALLKTYRKYTQMLVDCNHKLENMEVSSQISLFEHAYPTTSADLTLHSPEND
jgi:hypothetical protein